MGRMYPEEDWLANVFFVCFSSVAYIGNICRFTFLFPESGLISRK